jgi:hypothetical protein
MHPKTGTTLNVGPYNRKERPYSMDLEGRTAVFGCTEIEAATTWISRQLVGIYCWKQVRTEEGRTTSKSGHIYQGSVTVLQTELGHTAVAQFSRQLDTDFKEDFCVGFVR